MSARLGICLIVLMGLNGCAEMKPIDFKNAEPRFVLEKYFVGKTRAWGIFEDRFGNLRRQFSVDITGTWNGRELVLDERFVYSDGERDQRVWTIEKIDRHTYKGRAGDVIGNAWGESYGNTLNWRYDMDLKVGSGTLRVHFNDWMFLQSSGVLLNRAKVSKLGLEIGTVTLAFVKSQTDEVVSDAALIAQPPAASMPAAANR